MEDPYIQENGTLKNKLGIKEYNDLNDAERDIGFVKLIDVNKAFTKRYDAEFFKAVHKHIFEDIFDWAGKFRTVPIEKIEVVIPGLSLHYSEPKDISKDLDVALDILNDTSWKGKNIDEISSEFTEDLARIWRVHPFRDGNTRTTLAFADIYAREHGFPMDISMLLNQLSRVVDENGKIRRYSIRDKFVLAALDKKDRPEPEHLTLLIKTAIQEGINQEKERHGDILGEEESYIR